MSPVFNVDLKSVIFTSLLSGTAGQAGAEYKLTLADKDMEIAVTKNSGVSRNGNTVSVPYTISGDNKGNANRVSVLIMDFPYVAGADTTKYYTYLKLSMDSSETTDDGISGIGTFTLPSTYATKNWGTDYHVYILAEDVNDGKATDYASTPIEVTTADSPKITAQPQDITLVDGITTGTLSVMVSAAPGHSLEYQWYKSVTNRNWDGIAIEGATSSSYPIPTGESVGRTEYYYCVVTDAESRSAVTSNAAAVKVEKQDTPEPTPDSGNVVSVDEKTGTAIVYDNVSGRNVKVSSSIIKEGAVYRMYDPSRGEHFYTKDASERDALILAGWQHESNADFIVVSATEEDASPVYRLYNPNDGGMHFYTDNAIEAIQLKANGWRYEGISHYVYSKNSSKGISQIRLYNPNSSNGEHNWTTDLTEYNMLRSLGWKDEGVCWNIK